MTTVRINPLFQEQADLPQVIEVGGETVGECLNDIIRQFPHARSWLFDHDSLLRVMISINNVNIVTLDNEGLNKGIEAGDEIVIFALVSGG